MSYSRNQLRRFAAASVLGGAALVMGMPTASVDGIVPEVSTIQSRSGVMSNMVSFISAVEAIEFELGVTRGTTTASETLVQTKHHEPTQEEKIQHLAAFRLFDNDGDGKITTTELGTALTSMGHNFAEAELQTALNKFDVDGNGTIDFEEFHKEMANDTDHKEEIKQAFTFMDADGNDFISPQEFHDALIATGEHEVDDEEFHEIDSSGDGKINFEEFHAAVEEYDYGYGDDEDEDEHAK